MLLAADCPTTNVPSDLSLVCSCLYSAAHECILLLHALIEGK